MSYNDDVQATVTAILSVWSDLDALDRLHARCPDGALWLEALSEARGIRIEALALAAGAVAAAWPTLHEGIEGGTASSGDLIRFGRLVTALADQYAAEAPAV